MCCAPLSFFSVSQNERANLAGLGFGSSPDAESEGTFVDNIGKIVDDVDDALGVVREGRSQVHEVVSERVDDPSNGHNHAEGVESTHASLGSGGSGNLGALTSEDFVDNVQPSGHTDDESAEDGDGTDLTEVSTNQHDDRRGQELVEEALGRTGHSRKDEVELNNLERHGDEPVGVSVDSRRVLRLDPGALHEQVVPGGNACDEHSNRD